MYADRLLLYINSCIIIIIIINSSKTIQAQNRWNLKIVLEKFQAQASLKYKNLFVS